MEAERPKGRCVGCGLLAVRSDEFTSDSRYYEVEDERRQSGALFHLAVYGRDHQHAEPVCLAGCFDFRVKLNGVWVPQRGPKIDRDPIGAREAALRAINDDRHCPRWVRYQPGIEPSKALEFTMFEALEARLESSRRAWERTMESDRRAYEAQQNANLRKRDERFNWIMLGLAVAGVVFAAAQLLTAGPDSIIGRCFHLER